MADAIHEAVLDAGLAAPIVVGHSIGGPIASIYAIKYPAAAVVTVDQPVPVEPFAHIVRSLEGQLDPGSFAQTWEMFRESMHIELVPATMRPLLEAGEAATRELGPELLGRVARAHPRGPVGAGSTTSWPRRARPLCRISHCAAATWIRRSASSWTTALPHAEIVVWPVGHHFPHLTDPARFAAMLTGLAAGVPDVAPR